MLAKEQTFVWNARKRANIYLECSQKSKHLFGMLAKEQASIFRNTYFEHVQTLIATNAL